MVSNIASYFLMSAIIALGGYLFGLTLEQSIKIGLFSGLYVFFDRWNIFRKKSNGRDNQNN